MSNQDPIIVLGLSGEDVTGKVIDTIRPRADAFVKAGLSDIRHVTVTPEMNAADIQNALIAQAQEIRREQANARFLVFRNSVRPLPIEGSINFGAAAALTAKELKQAIVQVRSSNIGAPPAAQPEPISGHSAVQEEQPPVQQPQADVVLPVSQPVSKPKKLPGWLPEQLTAPVPVSSEPSDAKAAEPSKPESFAVAQPAATKGKERADRKQAKREAKARAAYEKPTIVMLHTKPVDVRDLGLSSSKAKLVHVLIAPHEVDARCLQENGLFNTTALGHLQGQKKENHPTFIQWANSEKELGLSFWNKFGGKDGGAVGTEAQLATLLKAQQPDAVMVCGDIPHGYSLSKQAITDAIATAASEKKQPNMITYNGKIEAQYLRKAVNDAAASAKVVPIRPEPEPAEPEPAEAPPIAMQVCSTATSRHAALPSMARSRSNNPHVLVLYAPGTQDMQMHLNGIGVDMDKALLIDHADVGGTVSANGTISYGFINPNGIIHKTALAQKGEPPPFIQQARSHYGNDFDTRIAGVFTQAEQLRAYLGKRRPHGSARETKAYDEVVLVGQVPEEFSVSRQQIEEACKAHKNNKGKPCVFTQLPDVASLHARFPVASVTKAACLG